MAASIQERNGKHQLRVTHRLLPRPFFFTFAERPAAESYRDQLTALLARGVVPQEMLARPAEGDDPLVMQAISGFEEHGTPSASDLELTKAARAATAGLRMSGLTYSWVEAWVHRMKVQDNLAPGSIRKRVGVLARAVDWHLKRVTPKGVAMPANPLRLLPKGYSQYTDADAAAVREKGGEEKIDETRDRRLDADEEHRVRLALSGTKRVDRERPLAVDEDVSLLFDLVLDTGLRLKEAYTLRVEQIDLEKGVIRLMGSKATRGQRKPRVVPLKKHLRERLRPRCKAKKTGLLLNLWDGQKESMKNTTSRLSNRFRTLFEYAAVGDFTEHDLRHEATCRWFELRDASGRWTFSEIEICRIMGWTNTKMALRYASLRGEDLADRLL
jgi:hypothetical protein